MNRAFGRGLNIAAQIDKTRNNYKQFTPITDLDPYTVADVGCGYLQSYFLLTDGQLIKNGAYMDTLTNVRMINFYRLLPRVFRYVQKIGFLGKMLSFRGGEESLTLLNKQEMSHGVYFERVTFGHAGIHGFDQDKNMHIIGQNYFGQRGTGDCFTKEFGMRKVEFIETEDAKNRKKIKDAVLGFQHSILITEDNEAYGCGKTDSYQIQPYRYHHYKDIITVDKIQKPELIWNRRRVIKAACGYRHSIFLTEDQKLYGLGLNKFGQCGADYLEHPHLTRATEIFFPYRQNETIIDIKCGSNHTLILTNLGLYFMGGVYNNQNPFLLYNENVSSPSVLNLDKKVIKIFANFDRSAIITEDGKALLFGGKDMSKIGGESGQLETIDEFKFDKDSLIGLGFSHTIIVP